MADFLLPDDIICNIISRFRAKPLLRFRCVSRYWNRTLREPNFMKLRSHKTVLLPFVDTFLLIDDTIVPNEMDMSNSIFKRCYPFDIKRKRVKLIGTFNGIVLFNLSNKVILYNPFTGVFKELPYPPTNYYRDAYGFAYGAALDDLKIVRFRQHYDVCDVYNFIENSWSSWSTCKYNIFIKFEHNAGHFVNGFLYWIAYYGSKLIAVNVKDMKLSEICLPFKINRELVVNRLGTINGCLCILASVTRTGFDMWVMKEAENQWSKTYSFELPLNEIHSYAICYLESKRILMWNYNCQDFIMYDTFKDSCKTLNMSSKPLNLWRVHALEYVETLVSPEDIMSSLI